MTSFSYGLTKAMLRLLPVKAFLSSSPEKLIRAARKVNAMPGRGFQIPKQKGFSYTSLSLQAEGGDRRCLRIRPELCSGTAAAGGRALLFLFGGGMVTEPDASDIKPALDISRQTEREVWYPFYPLCLDQSILPCLEMLYACYQAMLQEYKAEDICVLGYSSGAGLAMYLTHLILERGELPVPEQLILVSPGAVSEDPAWRARVAEIAPRDLLIGPAFLDFVIPLMAHGEELPAWIAQPWAGGLKGFPPCRFWFGGDEILAASVPDFEAACREAAIPYTMTVGQGLCHCYPFIPGPGFPEKTEALKQIVEQVREGAPSRE